MVFYLKVAILISGFCVFFNLFYSADQKRIFNKTTKYFVDISFCFLLAIITSVQFNAFKRVYLTDSAVFAYIGTMMHEGLVPYRDLFDHKGIILYLIQYLAAFWDDITVGLLIIEIVNLAFFAFFTSRFIGLFTENTLTRFTVLGIICCVCTRIVFEGGNFVEEYALPWLSLSVYLFFKWFQSEQLKKADLLWIGISFSVVLFLRPNMIAIWAALIPVVMIKLILKQQWTDLLTCICWFCMGMGLILLPLFIYFAATNSLQDMIDCYFIFNFSYADSAATRDTVLKAMLTLAKHTVTLIPSVLLSVFWEAKNKNKFYFLNLLAMLVTLAMAAMSGRMYAHYGIILLPTLALPLVVLIENVTDLFRRLLALAGRWIPIKHNNKISLLLCVICVFAVLLHPKLFALPDRNTAAADDPISVFLAENTQPEDDVLILGNTCSYYLTGNRSTANKYFYQTPPLNISSEIYEEFMSEIQSKPSDYVICWGERSYNSNPTSNWGKVIYYFEQQCTSGEYTCLSFEQFYVYQKE